MQRVELVLRLNVNGEVLLAGNDQEIQAAFNILSQRPHSALVIGNDPAYFIRRALLATLAASHRVPTIYYEREFAADGGLMSYGPKSAQAWEMAAPATSLAF